MRAYSPCTQRGRQLDYSICIYCMCPPREAWQGCSRNQAAAQEMGNDSRRWGFQLLLSVVNPSTGMMLSTSTQVPNRGPSECPELKNLPDMWCVHPYCPDCLEMWCALNWSICLAVWVRGSFCSASQLFYSNITWPSRQDIQYGKPLLQ